MIFTRLYDFQQYLENELSVPCKIGDPDLGSDEMPYVKLLLENEFKLFRQNEKTESIDLPVTIKIVTPKTDTQKALEVFTILLKKANQFFPYEGHILEGTGTPEYVDEQKTFEISVLYTLKLLEQDAT